MTFRPVALITFGLLSLLGCKRPPPPPPPLVAAHGSWSSNVLRIDGKSCQPCLVRFSVARPVGSKEPELMVTLEEGLGDLTVRFRGESRVASRKRASFVLPRSLFGSMNVKTGDLQLADVVRVEESGAQPFDIKLPVLRYGASLLFSGAPPMAFSEDVPVSGERSAWVELAAGRFSVWGPGTLARDVSWIITEKRESAAELHCTGYRDSRTGERRSVVALSTNSVLTVRDRRTGEVVKQETLKGPGPECPQLQVGLAASSKDVPEARIDAWVKQVMKAP